MKRMQSYTAYLDFVLANAPCLLILKETTVKNRFKN